MNASDPMGGTSVCAPPTPGPANDRSKRRWALSTWLLVAVLALAPPLRPASAQTAAVPASEAVAVVKRVSGAVQLHRGGTQQALKEGDSLLASDRLVSGADGMAAVVFRDGTRLTVGASTDLQLRRYAFEPKAEDYAFDLYLAKGRTVYASGKIGKLAPQSVRLETPTATVGVRGTRLILEAE